MLLLLFGGATTTPAPVVPAQYQRGVFLSGSSAATSTSGVARTIFLSGKNTATFKEN